MPIDIRPLVKPATTALLTNEVQASILGGDLESPLATSGRAVLPNIVRLAQAARSAGVQVVHCVKIFRRDALGRNRNIVLYQRRGSVSTESTPLPEPDNRPVPGSHVVPELGPDERDLVMTRLHGMGAVTDSGVDPVLRTLGISTVVVTGVSINIGVTNTVMDLVNRGYHVVVPRDAVAGTPDSYTPQILDNTIKFLATLTTTEDLLKAWGS